MLFRSGLLLSTTTPVIVLICLAAFVGLVAATRYVSVGSLVVVVIYLLEIIYQGQTGVYKMADHYLYEMYGIAAFLMILAFFKHRENIKRLLRGTENKISVGKSKSK